MWQPSKGCGRNCGKEVRSLELSETGEIFLPDTPSQLHVHELTFAAEFDQTRVRKLVDVVRKRRRSDRNFGLQVVAGHLPAIRDSLQDLEASRIGEGLSNAMELFRGQGHGHFKGTTFWPKWGMNAFSA
jgi:hypothetical protein